MVRNALYAIAEEMSVIVMRSARSPLLKEAGDLSSALTDAQGRLIAQGRDIPIHMGVMGFTVKEFLERVPADELRDGDVWFLNLPEVGGNHLPDVKAVRPVFFEGRLVAFAINLAHWADIGGAVPGSYVPWATECYQEGLRIAPDPALHGGGAGARDASTSSCRTCAAARSARATSSPSTRPTTSPPAASPSCSTRYGAETIAACFERLHAESEAQMRAALRALPDGVWEGEDWLDDDGVDDRPIRIHVRVDKRGDEATFDFSGHATRRSRGPVNTTYFIACSSVYYAMKALVAPDVPPNEGCYRPLDVIVPPRHACSTADPDRPVVGGNHETSQRVVDAIMKALAPGAARPRGGGRARPPRGSCIFGARRPDGRWAVLYEVHGGGEGAMASQGRRGRRARAHVQRHEHARRGRSRASTRSRVEEQALRPGSGGDGAHRGGLGFRRAYRVLGADVTLTTHDRAARRAALGLVGRRRRRAVSHHAEPGHAARARREAARRR